MSDLRKDLDALRIEREPDRPGIARWIVWIGLVLLLTAAGFGAYRWLTRERADLRVRRELEIVEIERLAGADRVGLERGRGRRPDVVEEALRRRRRRAVEEALVRRRQRDIVEEPGRRSHVAVKTTSSTAGASE